MGFYRKIKLELIKAKRVRFHNHFVTSGELFDKKFYQDEQNLNPGAGDEVAHYFDYGMLEGASPNRYIAYQRVQRMSLKPGISILIYVHDALTHHLIQALESVVKQVYDNWELYVLYDVSNSKETVNVIENYSKEHSKIKIFYSDKNTSVAEAIDKAAQQAKGEFVVLMDHDDIISPGFLSEIVKAYNCKPDTDVFYTDHLIIDEAGKIAGYSFKPGWSPWLFRSVMFERSLLVIRKSLAKYAITSNAKFDKLYYYQLMLRLSEKANSIAHIPKVLYKSRQASSSIANENSNNVDTHRVDFVKGHISRLNIPVNVKTNPKNPGSLIFEPLDDGSKISARVVLMPPNNFSGEKASLKHKNLVEKTEHPNLCWTLLDRSKMKSISWLPSLLDECESDFWVFLNLCCEPLQKNWLSTLLSYAALPGIGAVAPVIINKYGKTESAGSILAADGIKPVNHTIYPDNYNYTAGLSSLREVSVLSPDCLAVRTSILRPYKQLINEFGLAYNVVEALLNGRKSDFSYLTVPFVKIRRIGSAKSCLEEEEINKRFWMNYRRKELSEGDPYYNQNIYTNPCT